MQDLLPVASATTRLKYMYKVKDCNTPEEIQVALGYYQSELGTCEHLTHADKHNIDEIIFRLKAKQEMLEVMIDSTILSDLVPFQITREQAVIELVQLIPNFFQYKQPAPTSGHNWMFVIKMFKIYFGVLNNSDIRWSNRLYTDTWRFTNCGKKDEMIIYQLHEVITTGLHVPKQVIKQINLLIKLVKHLKIDSKIPLKLPGSKDFEVTLILGEFKY